MNYLSRSRMEQEPVQNDEIIEIDDIKYRKVYTYYIFREYYSHSGPG